MQSRAMCFFVTIWMVGSVLLGASRAEAQTSKRLSVGDADNLLTDWIKVQTPNMNPAYRHSGLKEITPKELWDRSGVQFFKLRDVTSNIPGANAFLIKDRKIYPLGQSFGGYGLTSFCVCALYHDSHQELVYTYSWGSGEHRSHLGVVRLSASAPVCLETEYVLMDTDMVVEKQNDQTVKVYSATAAFAGTPLNRVDIAKNTLLGTLKPTHEGDSETFDIQFEPGAPQKLRDQISKKRRLP